MLGQRVLTVLGEVVVADGELRLAGLEDVLEAALLGNRPELVAETLAVLVDPHGLGKNVHLAGNGEALHVHAGDGRGLEVSAGPVGHLHTVTGAVGHGSELLALDAGVGHVGDKVVHHGLVATEATRGNDDSLAVELDVALVVLGNKTSDLAVIHDDVVASGAEHDLGAGGDSSLTVGGLNLGLATLPAIEGAGGSPELDAVELRELVLSLGQEAAGHLGKVVLSELVEVPVAVLGRVLGELHDELGVGLVGRDLHPVVVELDGIDVVGAIVDDSVTVDAGKLVAQGLPAVLGSLLDQDDTMALLGDLTGGGDASVTVADNNDLGVVLGDEVGDLGGSGLPIGVEGSLGSSSGVLVGSGLVASGGGGEGGIHGGGGGIGGDGSAGDAVDLGGAGSEQLGSELIGSGSTDVGGLAGSIDGHVGHARLVNRNGDGDVGGDALAGTRVGAGDKASGRRGGVSQSDGSTSGGHGGSGAGAGNLEEAPAVQFHTYALLCWNCPGPLAQALRLCRESNG